MPKALITLNKLMNGIIQIGTQVYSDELAAGDRLFVHQVGDGFAIVSDSYESLLERPISIAIALMRHVVATTGHFASASIAEGDLADIQGCYPVHPQNGIIKLGGGIMTTFSVMGTAFIRAHKLSNAAKPSWPFLIMPESSRDRVPDDLYAKTAPCSILSINWIESQSPLIANIQSVAGLQDLSPREFRQKIRDYDLLHSEIVRKWKYPLCDYLNIKL